MNWLTGLIGAVTNTFAGYYDSKAKQSQFEADAARDEANATRAAIETTFAEEQARKQGRQSIANLSAAMAENGLQGAAFDKILEESIKNVYFDAMNVRNQGLSEFYNYKNSAAENRFQARNMARTRKSLVSSGIAQSAIYALAGAAKYNQNSLNAQDAQARAADIEAYKKSDVFKGGLSWKDLAKGVVK